MAIIYLPIKDKRTWAEKVYTIKLAFLINGVILTLLYIGNQLYSNDEGVLLICVLLGIIFNVFFCIPSNLARGETDNKKYFYLEYNNTLKKQSLNGRNGFGYYSLNLIIGSCLSGAFFSYLFNNALFAKALLFFGAFWVVVVFLIQKYIAPHAKFSSWEEKNIVSTLHTSSADDNYYIPRGEMVSLFDILFWMGIISVWIVAIKMIFKLG